MDRALLYTSGQAILLHSFISSLEYFRGLLFNQQDYFSETSAFGAPDVMLNTKLQMFVVLILHTTSRFKHSLGNTF